MNNALSARALALSVVNVLALFSLAACGGKQSTAPAPGGGASSKAAPAPRFAAAGPQAVVVGGAKGVVQVTVQPQSALPQAPWDTSSIRQPAALATQGSASRRASDTSTLLTRQASSFDPSLPLQGVIQNFASAVFSPNWTPSAAQNNRIAMATYRFSTTGYTGTPTIGITWVNGPDNYANYFVGLANFQRDRWEWFEGPLDGVITLNSLAPYIAGNGDLFVLVAMLGTTQCTLGGVSVGPPETRGTGFKNNGGGGGNDAPPLFGGSLPASVDLSGMCAPIRNQGSLGSCTAFAFGDGALNYEMRRIYGDLGWNYENSKELISPRYIYVETGKVQGLSCSEEGRYMNQILAWVEQHDCAVTEHNAPYLPTPCSDAWTQAALDDAAVIKPIKGDTVPCTTDAGIKQVKTLLAQGRLVPFGTMLDQAFMNWTPAQPPWSYSGPPNGGHAMCIVGYDDDKRAFKVRNSWGPEWGDKGYVWIAYDSLKNSATNAQCYVLEIEYNQAAVNRFFGGGGGGFPPPSGIAASDGTFTDKVRLTWNAVSGATGYKVYRDNQNAPVAVLGAVTTYDDSAAADGYSHTYWVRATKSSGDSAFSVSDTGFASSGAAAPVIYGVTYIPGSVGDQTQFFIDYYSQTPVTFSWTLGGCNPGVSSAESPTATFVSGGTQTISVTISNGSGNDTVSGDIYIPGGGSAPTAMLGANPTNGTAPLTVLLDASGSTDDNMIYRFDWDWEGDGTYDYTSDNYSQIYVDFPAGTWPVTVKVWDYDGMFDEAQVTITVTGGSQGGLSEFEPNDSFAQASPINYPAGDTGSIGSGSGYPGYDGDIFDYWGLQVTGGPVTFQCLLDLNSITGDLDLYIYDSQGNLGAWSESASNQEFIQVNLPVGQYYLLVYGYSGYSDYALSYNAF